MYSIIVCSIRPQEAEALRANIARTIGEGIQFEFLAYDNRGTGKGICQVYNECAEKAQYENLCFVHEDVEFLTENWGSILAEKLAEPDCGVIGFAGSSFKSRSLSGWHSLSRYGVRLNYVQGGLVDKEGKKCSVACVANPKSEQYSQVISVDGMCLFVKKSVWSKIRFDQDLLEKFHCYDLDFTIASHTAGFKNWVVNIVQIEHFSPGGFDSNWFEETKKLHEKWNNHLPLYTRKKVSYIRKKRYEFMTSLEMTNFFLKNGLTSRCNAWCIWYYWFTHIFNRRSYNLLRKYYGAKQK